MQRLGLKRGQKLKEPLIEFYYKCDQLNDPIINNYHIILLKLANKKEIEKIKKIGLKINKLLIKYFKKINFVLVDYKMEFGF